MKNKVLLVSYTQDMARDCVYSVAKAIEKNGGKSYIFDVNKYPSEYQLCSQFVDGKWTWTWYDGEVQHDMNDFCAIWMRRWSQIASDLGDILDKKYLSAAKEEARSLIYSMFADLDIPILDDPFEYLRYKTKVQQLNLAEKIGMQIPETCISNSIKDIRAFAQRYPDGIIAKPFTSYFFHSEEGVESTVFATMIKPLEFEDLSSLQFSPMIFQEPIPKKLELRIIVVGAEIFSFAIDSQKSERAKNDWRRDGLNMIKDWFAVEIPETLKSKLLTYMDSINRNYTAFDFILTPKDEYVFLEANMIGEFFWLDEISNYAISDALAKVLLGKLKGRLQNRAISHQ